MIIPIISDDTIRDLITVVYRTKENWLTDLAKILSYKWIAWTYNIQLIKTSDVIMKTSNLINHLI